MKIEVGKFYKTRDGRKVRIYAVDGADNGRIHGATLQKDGWYTCEWYKYGRYFTVLGNRKEDIVSEWVEPSPEKPKLKAWISTCLDGTGGYFIRFSDTAPGVNFQRAVWLDEPEESKE